ncbi:MAG: glycerol-3-phosphate acyltransferase [Clostridia bacterium]|nr:glycerol-3-phosphate acyltransferase [Clostridia bacterium]
MKIFLYILAAICGYVISGINPAIALSKGIYKKDVRECGSGNPGFTNFKRAFGNRWAWCVLILDLSKAGLVVGLFAWLLYRQGADFQIAAAYTGMFCMLGHAFPFQYNFKGGKGFLVCLSSVYIVDWRVGLIATGIMLVLLLTTKYMSLSTTLAMLSCPILMIPFGASVRSILMVTVSVIFMAIRHKENFKRLIQGKESKFTLKSKKQ